MQEAFKEEEDLKEARKKGRGRSAGGAGNVVRAESRRRRQGEVRRVEVRGLRKGTRSYI